MKKAIRMILGIILLLMALSLVGYVLSQRADAQEQAEPAAEPAAAEQTEPAAVQTAAVPASTPAPTPEPTPEATPEPQPERFTLSYIGDLTLTNHPYPTRWKDFMGEDYAYPLSNVADLFRNDEYTIGNLECTFSDRNLYSETTFHFLCPTAYCNILLEGGVDFVTTANNHTDDFYDAGREDTAAALEQYGVAYGKNGEAQVVTTPNGLKLGIYCTFSNRYGDFRPDLDEALAAIAALKETDADLIICAFHWGIELHVRPEQSAVEIAHACIDAGADIIYGSHPHCLQPVEEYNGGLILYSMGNFCFGGNSAPNDPDTAIVQVTIKRDVDGTVSREGYTLLPCCVSSRPVLEDFWGYEYNDYRPTLYVEGTEAYDRALSKIDGSYTGPNGEADYTRWHETHG